MEDNLPEVDKHRELALRFAKARLSALTRAQGEERKGETEVSLLGAVSEDAAERQALARRVFENAAKLGQSYARYHRYTPSREELGDILCQSQAPCALSSWATADSEPALVARRGGCSLANTAFACDFFAEAFSGLVSGLSDHVRHARSAAMGRGDAACIDVLYERPESLLRFGPIPEEMRSQLCSIERRVARFCSTSVAFVGLSHGTLFYKARDGEREGALSIAAMITREVSRRFPSLRTENISPRPVFSP